MKKPIIIGAFLTVVTAVAVLFGQNPDFTVNIVGTGGKPALAVIEFRGAGAAQQYMAAFNATLNADLQDSALFDLRPKSFFPKSNPQAATDLRPEDAGAGYALQDWAGAPVNASHLVFGYAAVTNNGLFVLNGNVYDTRVKDIQSAKMFAQNYPDAVTEAGAIKVAHAFAADIIQKFGGTTSLLNSRIYFTSNREATGQYGTEIWVMDWDGKNQKRLTSLKGQIADPTISPDGSRLAFTIWPGTSSPQPRIGMVSSDTGRSYPFYNQEASINATPTFTPDGTHILYSSSASNEPQIYSAEINGRNFNRLTSTKGNPTEPKVNPKNPDSLLFVQGFQNEQIYRMNAEGAGIERLTNGEGEASNPAWSPDGKFVAFAWTRGYQSGKFNIFVIDIGAPQKYQQLTHGEGYERNENPTWAPDGIHIVFMRTVNRGSPQIYTMLANGTQVKQLTTQGSNKYPVWGVK